MPRKPPAQTETEQLRAQLDALLLAAAAFVPARRTEEIVRKWLSGPHIAVMTALGKVAMLADAMKFSVDLMLSQPSQSGGTAFDRMARSRSEAKGLERQALDALREARYRLLKIDDAGGRNRAVRATDMISGELLHIVAGNLPVLDTGLAIFAHAVRLAPGTFCLPRTVTPLDAMALDVARTHPACAGASVPANARWAEAVFGHIVRQGTVGVAGLNCSHEHGPDDIFGCDVIAAMMSEWAALGDQPAHDTLLQRTRQAADTPSILRTLGGVVAGQLDENKALERGCTRAILVMMEVIVRRERCGSGGLSLDGIARDIEEQIAHNGAPQRLRGAFAALRRRLGPAGAAVPDNPELARLMQRIQGLRAKTTGHGCTEHEAIAAAEKIAELLDKHGLSLNEIEFAAQPCEGVAVATGRKRQKPIDSCMGAIAAFFDCRVWQEKHPDQTLRYIFFGLRADVAAARTLHELVERAFETETAAFQAGALYADMVGERRAATTSFQVGLARGIRGKLARLQAARATQHRSTTGRDLVQVKASLVDEELEKLGLSLSARHTGTPRQVLSDAFASGEAAGERFEWAEGIEEAA